MRDSPKMWRRSPVHGDVCGDRVPDLDMGNVDDRSARRCLTCTHLSDEHSLSLRFGDSAFSGSAASTDPALHSSAGGISVLTIYCMRLGVAQECVIVALRGIKMGVPSTRPHQGLCAKTLKLVRCARRHDFKRSNHSSHQGQMTAVRGTSMWRSRSYNIIGTRKSRLLCLLLGLTQESA